tara:strand:- start:243 stop:1100 length:858 start_codon:yes stop_codon:yes gene_type:complete
MTEDYLEVDNPIPGQNYVCLSFVSPEKTLKERELFIFNKFINQRCGEWELKLDEIVKDVSDDYKNKINAEIKEVLRTEMKFTLDEFKSKFEDFKYKFHDDLEKAFSRISGAQTSVRGVKVRGVYDSKQEAEKRAKDLQVKDRSFNIFVGQVGYWLPWDPQADRVEEEEYLEEELNTLMKEYRKNEVSRDIFYEEQKREQMKDAVTKQMNEERQAEQEALEADDPWMRSKFNNAQESTETPTESAPEEVTTTASEVTTTASEEPTTTTSEEQATTTSTEEPIEKVI